MRRAVKWLLFVVACGGQTTSQPDATTDGPSSDAVDDQFAEDAGDAADEKQWPIAYNIVDGGGDEPYCYPDGDIVQACCNGQYCRGFCLGLADGAIECSCYGISGGCQDYYGDPDPIGCCTTDRACEPVLWCDKSPQH